MKTLYQQLSQLEKQQKILQQLNNPTNPTPSPSAGALPVPRTQDVPANTPKLQRKAYRDFSKIMPPAGYKAPTEISQMNFAEKLHHILSRSDLESILEWRPHGRAFKVYVPQLFALHVCPEYFGHTSYARFCNDLKEHGFIKIPNGLDQNGYYHEMFLKYRMFLCRKIAPKNITKSMVKQAIQQQIGAISLSTPALHPAVASLLPGNPGLTQMFLNQARKEQQEQQQQGVALQSLHSNGLPKTLTTEHKPAPREENSLLKLASLV